MLKKTAATLREHARHIAGVMMDEVAKPYAAALSEVLRTADLFEFTAEEGVRIGTQFTTCFVGTKVQMLTQKALLLLAGELLLSDAFPGEKRNKLALVQAGPTQFTCFTGTQVQILTQKALQRVPLGVVVAIPPYNYPLNLAGSKVGPALMAGNSVVMKPPSAGAVTGILGIAAGAQLSVPRAHTHTHTHNLL